MYEESRPVPETERPDVDTRTKRLDRLREMVDQLFPGEERRELRENIERSFSVPQFSDYHNEGAFMDSHLDLIVHSIEAVEAGQFPEELSASTCEVLTRAVARDPEAVRRYVFLHDISKADCLTIKFNEGDRAVTWEEWQVLLASSESGRKAQTGDEDALRTFCLEQGIEGISYFQQTDDQMRQHGRVGAEELRSNQATDDETMLHAIEAHEVAYQFSRINVKTYEGHFSGLSDDARDFALLGSFVDTMSSVRLDSKPDLSNFLALAGSREKYEALVLLAERLKDVRLDKQKFQRACAALRESGDPLSLQMIDKTEARLRQECRLAGYDVAKLQELSEALVADGTLTAEERDRLIQLAQNEPQGIGRAFGPKMRLLSPILKQCQT